MTITIPREMFFQTARALANQGLKVAAIKLVRTGLGLSILAAKEFVEAGCVEQFEVGDLVMSIYHRIDTPRQVISKYRVNGKMLYWTLVAGDEQPVTYAGHELQKWG